MPMISVIHHRQINWVFFISRVGLCESTNQPDMVFRSLVSRRIWDKGIGVFELSYAHQNNHVQSCFTMIVGGA